MRKTIIAAMAIAALGACSKHQQEKGTGADDRKTEAAQAPKGHFTIHPPVQMSTDPAKAHDQQEQLVADMVRDPGIDLETLRGEAGRRNVTLTDAQVAQKKAQATAAGAVAQTRPAPTN